MRTQHQNWPLDFKCPVKCLNEEYPNEFCIQAESRYKSSQSESRIITTQISKAFNNRRYQKRFKCVWNQIIKWNQPDRLRSKKRILKTDVQVNQLVKHIQARIQRLEHQASTHVLKAIPSIFWMETICVLPWKRAVNTAYYPVYRWKQSNFSFLQVNHSIHITPENPNFKIVGGNNAIPGELPYQVGV